MAIIFGLFQLKKFIKTKVGWYSLDWYPEEEQGLTSVVKAMAESTRDAARKFFPMTDFDLKNNGRLILSGPTNCRVMLLVRKL